jgi:membrane protein DedA with SNARE-associated domain
MPDVIIAALIEIPGELGYLALALFVGIEASGVPVPGETALITASVLASQGELEIALVIAIAAAAAIVGDNIGYAIGSRVGRRVMVRPGRTQERRMRALARGDDLFERHGPKAVFFGRWVALLRIWASWLAGMTSMRWQTFLVWNALGGIAWAICFGLIGYFGGRAAAELIARAGVGVAILVGVALVIGYVVVHRRAGRDG